MVWERKGFFFEKRSKKLFLSGAWAFSLAQTQTIKVFFASFLFTKKKTFLSYSIGNPA